MSALLPVAKSFKVGTPKEFKKESYFVTMGWKMPGWWARLTIVWSDGTKSLQTVVAGSRKGVVAEATFIGTFYATKVSDRPALVRRAAYGT